MRTATLPSSRRSTRMVLSGGIRLHQLALEVLRFPAPADAVVEAAGLPLLQQPVHAADGAHPVEQRTILPQYVVLDVGLDVLFVVAHGELLPVAIRHGLPHAIADGLPGVLPHGVDVLVGNRQRLNQVVLGGQLLLLGGDPPQGAQHGAVPARRVPLHGEEGAARPAAAPGHVLLYNDRPVAQPGVDGVEVGEAAHDRLIGAAHQRVGHVAQRLPGVTLLAQHMAQVVQTDELLEGVLDRKSVV